MSTPWLVFLLFVLATLPVHALLYRRQRRHGQTAIIDFAWAVEVGLGALLILAAGAGAPALRLLAGAAMLLWGLRLGRHLWRRIGGEEDQRYVLLRERFGERAEAALFGFFLLQSVFVALFLLPFPLIAQAAMPGPVFVAAGALLLALSLAGTWLADRQLHSWRSDPAQQGRTCRQGLWAWSRHPNYFFEWLGWCAWPLLAGSICLALQPLLLLWLLLRVTGIPYTERAALRKRGADYQRYQREVSAFLPLPPRHQEPQS